MNDTAEAAVGGRRGRSGGGATGSPLRWMIVASAAGSAGALAAA